MAKLATTTALLLFLTVAALAQAQGPTVLLTPDPRFGATAFTPGAVIRASGRVFDSTPTSFSIYQIAISLVPSGQRLRVIQVGVDHALFYLLDLNTAQPVEMTGVTGIQIIGHGINEIVPLTGSATPAAAKPTLFTTGTYTSFQFPVYQSFSGVITFGPAVGLITIALHGSAFGVPGPWVVEIVNTTNMLIEMPAQSFSFDPQSHPELLLFQLPRLPAGFYFFQARSVAHPGIVSNVVTLQIVS